MSALSLSGRSPASSSSCSSSSSSVSLPRRIVRTCTLANVPGRWCPSSSIYRKLLVGHSCRHHSSRWVGLVRLASSSSSSSSSPSAHPPPSRVSAVIVGGGWAAFAAAWGLVHATPDSDSKTLEVTVLDAAPTPGGVAAGSAELGIKGYWRHYKNVKRIFEQLDLSLDESYGPYAETAFYSEARGLEVVSPVFASRTPQLPAPFGTLAYTADRFTDLPPVDRLSAFPLFFDLMCFDADEETYAAYDKISFAQLVAKRNASQQLYDVFLKPVLIALMFAPPEELSAAACLAVLTNYVLSHQNDFDVRWPSAPQQVFERWTERLVDRGVELRGSTPVSHVLVDGNKVAGVQTTNGENIEAQIVILACGASALPRIIDKSPAAVRECAGLRDIGNLTCSAVTAARLTAEPGYTAPLRYASNVFGGLDGDKSVAGTFYDVGALMPEGEKRVFGQQVEVDTYNAQNLVNAEDDAIVSAARRTLALADERWLTLPICDVRLARAKNAATRFVPGSNSHTPAMIPDGAPRGLFCAGDVVRQSPADFNVHRGARGLSQEKALVTGLAAAEQAAKDFLGLREVSASVQPLAVDADEEHISIAKESVRRAREQGFVRLDLG